MKQTNDGVEGHTTKLMVEPDVRTLGLWSLDLFFLFVSTLALFELGFWIFVILGVPLFFFLFTSICS